MFLQQGRVLRSHKTQCRTSSRRCLLWVRLVPRARHRGARCLPMGISWEANTQCRQTPRYHPPLSLQVLTWPRWILNRYSEQVSDRFLCLLVRIILSFNRLSWLLCNYCDFASCLHPSVDCLHPSHIAHLLN